MTGPVEAARPAHAEGPSPAAADHRTPSTGREAAPSVTMRRHVKAPPVAVYAAWTRPEQLAKWWGPASTVAVDAELDVRVGGRFFIAFTTPDGERHGVGGAYRDVAPGERLVFDWAWQSTPERVSLVSLRFAPDGDGTLFTLVHEQFFDETARDNHARGWTVSLDRLAALFEAGA